MLSEYIAAAMKRATYRILPDDEGYYGEVPELPGVLATAETLEECREQLREVVEEWVSLGLQMGDELPVLDGIDLVVKSAP